MTRARRPVTIDGIGFDALIDETKTLEADVPSYPVERGFEVSDSIILKPLLLSMTLYLTNTPVTWKARHGASPSRVQDVLKRLEDLYFKGEPVTVVTSERTYRNMAILSIELNKTIETGSSREIPVMFQQIRVTEAQTTTIPDSYGRGGASGVNAGTASTTQSRTPPPTGNTNSGSMLFNIANGAGLLGGLN